MDVKRNRKLPVLVVIVLIAIVLAASFIYDKMHENSPSKEMAKLSEVYPSEDGCAGVIANGVLSKAQAIWQDHMAYLSLGIVRNELNHHFYWDDNEKLLTVTTADEVVDADENTRFGEGRVFLTTDKGDTPDERIYVSLDYVAKYTNIQVESYSDPARVFIRTRYGSCSYANALEGAAVRTEMDVKSPMLMSLEAGTSMWVISESGDWLKVYVGGENGGHVGYVQKSLASGVVSMEDLGPYQAPAYVRTTMDEPICLTWQQVFDDSGLDSLESLLENTSGVNVISPTWFSIMDSEGLVESRANQEYVDIVHSRGMKIWALVENINTDIKLDNARLLNTTSSRRRVIDTLISEATAYGIDGLNVDLEGLPSSAGDGYLQFIRELAVSCRKNGLVISVDNYVPSAWTTHYQRDKQAEVIDYLIIMAYDEHYKGSEAGSTASLPFVKAGIEDTIQEGVPAEMIICGIPFYSRLWTGDGSSLDSETISMTAMKNYLEEYEIESVWETDLGQYYAERKNSEGVLTRLWVEDTASVQAKLDLIAQYPLAGIAGWKLGMESADIWPVIASYLAR